MQRRQPQYPREMHKYISHFPASEANTDTSASAIPPQAELPDDLSQSLENMYGNITRQSRNADNDDVNQSCTCRADVATRVKPHVKHSKDLRLLYQLAVDDVVTALENLVAAEKDMEEEQAATLKDCLNANDMKCGDEKCKADIRKTYVEVYFSAFSKDELRAGSVGRQDVVDAIRRWRGNVFG